ncbi:NAD-dependent epimerase/dehydratase [Nitratireductor basaltis]|uniref:NAD-dependent epimerase/dehydratase n=2 Tax=Nitratireductor basaltis TaxID=472175 RepID=A0A084U781_9HYPH|nr:NAD-dependent epimerase/dehydratase [Nitratireductor basaltis]
MVGAETTMKIVVTGATGFVGRHLCRALGTRGYQVRRALRSAGVAADADDVVVGEIGPRTDWSRALVGADAVVHLAGPAHGRVRDDAAFFSTSDAGTARLLEAMEEADLPVMVNMSSIAARRAEEEGDGASAYGRSKLAGERRVSGFAKGGGLLAISLRPPLVYGADAPGNWARLMRLARLPLPLPFASVNAARSFCAVENLCDAIISALEAGASGAKGAGVYEICDAETVTLAEVLTLLRAGAGRRAHLVPVPVGLLRSGIEAAGMHQLAEQLFDPLLLDASPFAERFGWQPPVAAPDAIKACSARKSVPR